MCLPGAIIATSFTLGRKDNLHKVMRWIHENTAAGLVIFGLLYIWFTVMFLPPALLAACAGALYGFLLAIPIVWFFAIVSTNDGLVSKSCSDSTQMQLCARLRVQASCRTVCTISTPASRALTSGSAYDRVPYPSTCCFVPPTHSLPHQPPQVGESVSFLLGRFLHPT